MIRQAAATATRNGQLPRLIHVTAPRAGNSFLHHQDGLFLLDRQASERFANGTFETMDRAVMESWKAVDRMSSEQLQYYRPCPASPMVMVTAEISLAMDILDLLDRESYHRARLMPTHDNVVKALRFLRSLNSHRRTKGQLAAITLGPKYPLPADA